MGRSKQSYRASHESLQKNLEGKSTEAIMEAMTDEDDRFLSVDVDTYSKQCQSHWKMPRRLL